MPAGEHSESGAQRRETVPPPPSALRTDVRRALVLLAEGRLIRADRSDRGRTRATVQLSKHRGDEIPIGADVLGLLCQAGYVAEGRRLPGGARRFDLTPAGRTVLGVPPDPAVGPDADPGS